MQLTLVSHPATPSSEPPFKVWAQVDHAGAFGAMATTNIWFCVAAPMERFVIPSEDEPHRADDLWRTTCLEAFLQASDATAYREWNFAPSGNWAAYDFNGYRDGMVRPNIAQSPYIRLEDNFTWWALGATIAVDADTDWRLGLSAVLEEKNGTKSYWALAHCGEKPDFHDAGCFTAKLA